MTRPLPLLIPRGRENKSSGWRLCAKVSRPSPAFLLTTRENENEISEWGLILKTRENENEISEWGLIFTKRENENEISESPLCAKVPRSLLPLILTRRENKSSGWSAKVSRLNEVGDSSSMTRSIMTRSSGMQASMRGTSLQEGSAQLLPGIPDDVTFCHIIPKLPCNVFYILSSVSRAWLHGIRTRQVYDARVLSHSTETLAFVRLCRFTRSGDARIRPACTKLPPTVYRGGQCLCSNGYIYLLTGEPKNMKSWKIFVFDVAGQRQWKECPRMNGPTVNFAFGAIHGKLYVFGGGTILESSHAINRTPILISGSKVYDPKEDCWSPIRPMPTFRFDYKVETVGDELFVYGGSFLARDHLNAPKTKEDAHSSVDSSGGAKFLEVYHPGKDEWRTVNPFGRNSKDFLFAAGGKLYSIDWSSIHVYTGENSWTHLHSFSFPISQPLVHQKLTALVCDGEVVVSASWRNRYYMCRRSRFRSKGFGGESEHILWQVSDQYDPESPDHLVQL